MARVTVEDCVVRIPNRFDLVMMASQRARGISAGAQLTVDRDDDKNPVVALREIAEEMVSPADLEEEIIKSMQTFVEMDEPEDEEIDMLAIQQDMNTEMGGDAGYVATLENAADGDDGAAAADAGGDIMATIGEGPSGPG